MRWDGGSISWSKIIRGSIASSITDSAYQPNTALSPACSRARRSVAAQTQSVPVAYKRGAQQYRQRVKGLGSAELSRAAKMSTPIPPQCLRTEMNDVTVFG